MVRIVPLLVALALAVPASANVGRSDFPGMRSSEPGGLREVAIEREVLRFDLRPLAARGQPKVSATYQLDNRGAAVTAPLVFVSGASRVGHFEVALDGKAVPGGYVAEDKVAAYPASWRAPVTTPSLDGGEPLAFESEPSTAVAFTLEITPGRHTLAVTYEAEPQMTRSHGGATILWQVGYVLAPARDWGSFGTIDITVEVPPGWQAAVSPALARSGDTLHARFSSLPADALGITAQAPAGALHAIVQIALPLLLVLVLLGGGYVLYRIGRARGRQADKLGGTVMLSLGSALGWAIAIAVAGGFAAMRVTIGLPDEQSAAHGYGAGFGVVLAVLGALIALPIGFVIVRAGVRGGEGSLHRR